MRIERVGYRSAIGPIAAAAILGLGATGAFAAGIGHPEPWQMDMQGQVSDIGREVYQFHHWVNWLMVAITLFVAGLLVACIVKFNHRSNPVASRTTHHTLLEVAWTIVPVLILVAIAIPSFRVLRTQLADPKADVIVKVIGHQWYWEYEYAADQGGGFKFDQRIIAEADDQAKARPGPNGEPRLLASDNEMVVPANKIVKIQVTATDVLHSWGLPSLGFTVDAIPGRLNQMWFRAGREGVYYGQCRELCGQYHAYMPLVVRVVNDTQYAQWLDEAKKKYASLGGNARLASNTPSSQ